MADGTTGKGTMQKFGNPSGIETGVHWIQGTVIIESVKKFMEFCQNLCKFHKNDSFRWSDTPTRMGKLYKRSAISMGGLRVGYSENDQLGIVEGFFMVPGSYLELLDLKAQLKILKFCNQFKITRIDIAFNDFEKVLTPHKLHLWAMEGKMRGFRTHSSPREDFRQIGFENLSQGATKTFGSRASQKYLRVYDALPVHNLDATRWELELRDDRARTSTNLILEAAGDVESEIRGQIVGCINFVEPLNSRSDRCEIVEEWKSFIDYVGSAIKVKIAREKTTLDQSIDWLFKQVAKTLAIAVKVKGYRINKELLICGKSKIDQDYIRYHTSPV